MPARAMYYEADIVRALIENWARWPGWAGHTGSRSTLAWLDDFVANKRQGDHAATIPVMGGEAADTHKALGRLAPELGEALIVHYTWRGTANHKLTELAAKKRATRMSRATFFRRVADAHTALMNEYRGLKQAEQIAGRANVKSADAAGSSIARRHRFQLSPKMGLKAAEKEKGNNTEDSVSENGV